MTDPATQIVVLIAGLLLAAGLISALAKQTRLPETVYLTVFGLLIGGLLRLLGEGVGDGWMWLAPNDPLPLSSEALLFIFLPPFLFAAGLQIDVRRMQDDVVAVIVLAVLAVIVCTLVVAVSIELVVEVSILLCFLLSSIVATTDAAAILSVFRDLGAPRRLTTLVEGESLFNDAAAIAIFSALISFVAQGLSPPPLTFLTLFVTQLLGGLLVGFAVARLIVWLVRLIEDVPLAEISLTIALAYLSYFVAEGVFSVSGTIAVVTSAIVFGLDGRTALSPGAWRNLSAIWEILDYWATALVVLLVAIAMPLVVDGLRASDFVVPLVIFVSAIVARIIVLFGLFPLLSRLSLFEPVSMPFRLILTWGGLRGVVTILLALSVLDVPMLGGQEAQRFLLVSAVLYVLLTLLVQATTLRPLMRLLKLNKLTPEEEAYLQRFRRHLSQRVVAESEEIGTAAPKHALPAEGGLEAAPDRASRRADGEPNELQVALVLLATHERELYFNYFSRGIIGRRLAESLRTDAERVLEGARSDGAQGYMQNALRGLTFGPWFGFAQRVLNWTGWEGPLRARLARRFEMSAVKLRAFSTLKHFAAGDIRPVVGEDIWLRIDELIDTRAKAVAEALEGMRLQFPSYAEDFDRHFAGRVALGLENAALRTEWERAVITREMYDDLEEDRRRRLASLSSSPTLDLGIRLTSMLRRVTLFCDLTQPQLEALARRLQPAFMVPGETIIREGEAGRSMFFIASGTVSVERGAESFRLSTGDHFGEVALISGEARNATVRAEGFGQLLILRRRDFAAVSAKAPELRAAIERTAQSRH